jgi:hypothetical protein
MEKAGYRLVKVSCFWWFKFFETQKKDVQYIYCYSLPRSGAMIQHEQDLRSIFYATAIDTGKVFYSCVYRVTKPADLSYIKSYRQEYLLKKVFMFKIFWGLFFCLCGTFLLWSEVDNQVVVTFLVILSLFSSIYTAWYVYGLLYTLIKHKRENDI